MEETNKISSTFSVKNFIKNFANKIESNKIEKENVSFTLKRKTENEEIKDDKNLTEENKVEKKEPEDENKNKDNIVKKEISKAKDGILKIKLPALAKKEPSIVTKEMAKSNSIEQKLDDEKKMISMGKSIEMKGKGLPASNENNNENKNDNNGNNNNSADGKGIIGKPKIPLPKIKMELKKENLNKILLNKTIAKTSTDETNMSNTKNEEGTKPKFSIFKKDTPLNKKEDSAKVSKFAKISKTVLNKNDMEQNKIAEGSKANDVAMKKETTAKGEIVSEKKKTSKGSMFSFFKLRHSKVENEGDTTKVGEVQKGVSETQKKEVGNKAIEKDVSKMIKLPIQKKEAPSITSRKEKKKKKIYEKVILMPSLELLQTLNYIHFYYVHAKFFNLGTNFLISFLTSTFFDNLLIILLLSINRVLLLAS